MSSGNHYSREQASTSTAACPGQRTPTNHESSDFLQKRRRKETEPKLPKGLNIPSSGSGSVSQPPIRPRSSAPILPANTSSSTATRYRPILPAPIVIPAQKQEPTFIHGPTNLPPEPYRGEHPYIPKAPALNIHRTAAERLPRLEARINRLENAMEKYIDQRSSQALERSNLPRSSSSGQTPNSGTEKYSHKSPGPSNPSSSSR